MKTRIHNSRLSPDFSEQLQTAMLLDTIKGLTFIPEKIIPVIMYHPENKKNLLKKLIIDPLIQDDSKFASSLNFIPQIGIEFVDRFKNAFKHIFQELNLSSALIIGSDTPHLH